MSRFAWGRVARVLLFLTLSGCFGRGEVALGPEEGRFGEPFVALERVGKAAPLRGDMVEAREGDWYLHNERLGVVVSGSPRAGGFALSAGNLLDAAPVGEEDALREVFTYFDDAFPRQAVYETVAELPDSVDTRRRLLARGHDSENPALRVETVYELEAGSDRLVVATTVRNTGTAAVTGFELGDVISWGRAVPFAPGPGENLAGSRPTVPFLAAGFGGTAYAWVSPQGELDGPHGVAWSDPIVTTVDLPPAGEASVARMLVVVPGSVAEASVRAWEIRGVLTGWIQARVHDHAGNAAPGVGVVAADRGGAPRGEGRTDAEGTVWIPVPAGEYAVTAADPERGVDGPERRRVEAGTGSTVTFSLPRPARLALRSVDPEGNPLSTRWTLTGLPAPKGGNPRTILVPAGSRMVRVPPGRYRVLATRGPARTPWEEEISVASGDSTALDAVLAPLPVSADWIPVDLHVHAVPSADSYVSLADRARSLACEGIAWFAATDHGTRTSYGSVLDTLRLASPLRAWVGEEVSVPGLGHVSAFPLPFVPGSRGNGAVNGQSGGIDAVLDALRGSSGALVQLNHPRSGRDGYFDNIGFDPEGIAAGEGGRLDFDLLEVMNGKRPGQEEAVWRDWMALLAAGRAPVAVGSSDSHGLLPAEAGTPRTYVHVPGSGGAARGEEVLDALRGGRAVVTNGPFVEFTLDGRDVGSTVSAAPGTVTGRVRVIAPPWADVSRVTVVVNGKDDTIYPVRGKDRPVRFDEPIEVTLLEPGFVLVRVEGGGNMEPVVPRELAGTGGGRPFAFTNPIWVEILSASR